MNQLAHAMMVVGGGGYMNINIRTQKPQSTCKQMNSLVEGDVHKPPQAPVNKHNRSGPNNTLHRMNDKNLLQSVRPLEVSHNGTIKKLLVVIYPSLGLDFEKNLTNAPMEIVTKRH